MKKRDHDSFDKLNSLILTSFYKFWPELKNEFDFDLKSQYPLSHCKFGIMVKLIGQYTCLGLASLSEYEIEGVTASIDMHVYLFTA